MVVSWGKVEGQKKAYLMKVRSKEIKITRDLKPKDTDGIGGDEM